MLEVHGAARPLGAGQLNRHGLLNAIGVIADDESDASQLPAQQILEQIPPGLDIPAWSQLLSGAPVNSGHSAAEPVFAWFFRHTL